MKFLAMTMMATAITAQSVLARQDERPQPVDPPTTTAGNQPQAVIQGGDTSTATQPATNGHTNGRTTGFERPESPGKVKLGFDDVSVKEIIPFIMEATGKVVMPVSLPVLTTKKVTLMNDQYIERAAALDLLITALRLNGVGVIEREDVVILDDIANINRIRVMPVLTADDDVLTRTDKGLMVVKIFKIKEVPAASINELLQENLPDNATLTADANSNQLVLFGDIGLAQHLQMMINQLDRKAVTVETKVFDLRYADANEVADQIVELFEDNESQTTTGAPRPPRNPARGNNPNAAPTATAAGTSVGPSVQLRVSVNTQQNNITVSAEPKKITAIAKLITEWWDLPRPEGTAKVYKL